jgi:hypothetical protein
MAPLAGALVMGTAQPFAVDGNELALGHLEHRAHPGDKALFELLGADASKHIAERVVRGDAVGKFHKLPKPLDLGVAKLLNLDPVVGAADDATDSERDDVDEVMALAALYARIVQVSKTIGEAGKGGLAGHRGILLARGARGPG